MDILIFDSKPELGRAAADDAADSIKAAIAARGRAVIIAATGASQFEFFEALTARTDIDWSRVVGFHLDEYIGLPASHPASFRRYLAERLVDRVRPGVFHFVHGDAADPAAECARLGAIISRHQVDVAFVGIGENGHLAFNDPPADFETATPYLVVDLDERCRRQQLGEGWFGSLDDVPSQAISMSIKEILRARQVLCIVPDRRKAEAVHACLDLPPDPERPASALQTHPALTMYLDRESSSLLRRGAGDAR
jgi:glucosamine-6-phosphate deaminase